MLPDSGRRAEALTATLLIGLLGTTLMPWGIAKVTTIVLEGGRPIPKPAYYYGQYEVPRPSTVEAVGMGLVPPWVLARTVVPFEVYSPTQWWYREPGPSFEQMVVATGAGLAVYCLMAWILTAAARRRFGRTLQGVARRQKRAVPSPPQPIVIPQS